MWYKKAKNIHLVNWNVRKLCVNEILQSSDTKTHIYKSSKYVKSSFLLNILIMIAEG